MCERMSVCVCVCNANVIATNRLGSEMVVVFGFVERNHHIDCTMIRWIFLLFVFFMVWKIIHDFPKCIMKKIFLSLILCEWVRNWMSLAWWHLCKLPIWKCIGHRNDIDMWMSLVGLVFPIKNPLSPACPSLCYIVYLSNWFASLFLRCRFTNIFTCASTWHVRTTSRNDEQKQTQH